MKRKGKKVVLQEPEESDSEDLFYDSQEELPARQAKKVKKSAKNGKTEEKRKSKAKSKKSARGDSTTEPSSDDNDPSNSSDENGDSEENTEGEENSDNDQNTTQSLAALANGKFNKKLERTAFQVKRLLSRVEKNKVKKDKASIEKVKSELNSAITLLDKATAEQENGTLEQWKLIEDLSEKVVKEQGSNMKKQKKLEVDNQRRAQLPKAVLESWNGETSTLHNWILKMKKTLRFDDETLNVASLKKCIGESKEKKSILKRLQYCETLDDCFSKLEEHYGDFSIALNSMDKKIKKLEHHPVSIAVESENIEELLEYINQMRAHKKEKEIINERFINDYMHKLTTARGKLITDKKVTTCDRFEFYLNEILLSNKRFGQTNPQEEEKEKHKANKPRGSQLNSTQVEETPQSEWKTICPFCDGESGPREGKHPVWECEKLSNETSVKDAIKMVTEKGRCAVCLRKKRYPHRCPEMITRKHKCYTHSCNRALCKCVFKKKEVQNNCNKVDTNNKDSFINGVALGSTGFFSESIKVKTNKGAIKNLIVNYDTLASHSTGDEKVLEKLTEKIEELGVEMNVKTYTGIKTEKAKKCKVTVLTENGEKEFEFLLSKNFSNNLNKSEYQVPLDWVKKYKLDNKQSEGGNSYLLLGMDLFDHFPEVLE